jgi:ABC-type nitrate/sulfonate/bicarbonate transport system permease component
LAFSVALAGYLAAIAISVPLGAALASSAVLSRALYPILVVVQSTPVVAVAPIIVLRVSTTLSVIGSVVAQFVAAERGPGYLIFFSTSYFKVPQAFASLAVLVTLSLVRFRAVGALQQRLFPWSLRR